MYVQTGPLLFTIFINYLPLSTTSHIQIFADDTKIYNTVQDSGILKNDLDKLVLWSKEWLLPFNIDKCNILHFGKNNPNIEYNMEEKIISASRTIKHLGIIIEDNLKFEEHMSEIVNNANSKLGIIKNYFHELTKDLLFFIKYSFCPSLNTVVQLGFHILSRTIKKLRKYRKGPPN